MAIRFCYSLPKNDFLEMEIDTFSDAHHTRYENGQVSCPQPGGINVRISILLIVIGLVIC